MNVCITYRKHYMIIIDQIFIVSFRKRHEISDISLRS